MRDLGEMQFRHLNMIPPARCGERESLTSSKSWALPLNGLAGKLKREIKSPTFLNCGRDMVFVDKMPLRRFRLIHFRARSRMPPPACAPGPPGPSAGAGASCQAGNGEKTFQTELTKNENKYMGEKKHRNRDLFFVGVPGGCLAGSSCTRPGSPGRRTARAEGRTGRSETWCSRG